MNCTSGAPERSTASAASGSDGPDRPGQGVDGAAEPPGVAELDHAVHRRAGSVRAATRSRPAVAQAGSSGGRAPRRCRPAPRRPRPRRAGPGRRPGSAGRRAGPPPAAGPSGSATPSTSRRRPPRRAAAGCPRVPEPAAAVRAASRAAGAGSRPSGRRVAPGPRPASCGRRVPDRLLQPGRGLAGRRGQRDPQGAGPRLVAGQQQGQHPGDGGGLAGARVRRRAP